MERNNNIEYTTPRGNHARNPPASAAGTRILEVPNLCENILMNETDANQRYRMKKPNIGMKDSLKFATWNVRTLYETGKLEQLKREMIRYKIDLLAVQETRWTGQGEKQDENTVFLYSGRPEGDEHSRGVGFLMSKKISKAIIAWYPISERLIAIKLKTRARNLIIINVYAPTEVQSENEKDEFYDSLSSWINSNVHNCDIAMVLGDFNAKVGPSNTGLEKYIGKHGVGVRNNNGERLLELCCDQKLVVGGTLFPHKLIHKTTWTSPNGITKNQIDHVLINSKWRSSLLDVRSKRGADMNSDHCLVVCSVRLKVAALKSNAAKADRKFDVAKLEVETYKNAFMASIRNRLPEVINNNEANINEISNGVAQTYREIGQLVLGFRDHKRKIWLTQTTWDLVEQRKALKHSMLNELGNSVLSQANYRDLSKRIKKSARKDKRMWIDGQASQAESAARIGDMKTLYAISRALCGKHFYANSPILSSNGVLLTSPDEQLIRWMEHFKSTLNNPIGLTPPIDMHIEGERNCTFSGIVDSPPTIQEVKNAIKCLKRNKAPGNDNISAEMLLCDLEVSATLWHPFVLRLWEEEVLPISWNEGILIKIPKKGDAKDCNNYRGITLLPVPSKILSRVILNRISDAVFTTLRENQFGFRENRSCVDLTNTVRIVLEQCYEFRTPIYLAFIDFMKAFDSVNRSCLWRILESRRMPTKILNLIRAMYADFKCRILHKGKLSDTFDVTTGVRQGCILSPILFILVIDDIMRMALNGRRGIQWTPFKQLEDIEYADDVCLMSQRPGHLQENIDAISVKSRAMGLVINTSKTKIMPGGYGANSLPHINVDNEVVECVDTFNYLGSLVSTKGGADEDIKARINKAKSAFGMLRSIWKSQQISTNTKLRIYNSNVKSILFYGCETWKRTSAIDKRLQTFANKCLRQILNIWWPNRIRNDDLLNVTNQIPAPMEVSQRKWRWIGHTLRRPTANIARQALQWNPQGRGRRVGAPARTWRRSIDAELQAANYSWNDVIQTSRNRVRYKRMVEALCSTGSQG